MLVTVGLCSCGDGSIDFLVCEHLADIGLYGVALAGEVSAAGGDTIVGVHWEPAAMGCGFAPKL